MKFQKVEVVHVTIKRNNTLEPVRIYRNRAAVNFAAEGMTDFKTDCQIHTAGLQENQIGFSFNFSRILTSNLQRNNKVVYTVVVDVQVTYQNQTKKRFSLQTDGNDPQTYESSTEVTDDGAGATDTNTVLTAFTESATSPIPTVITESPTTRTATASSTETGGAFTLIASLMVLLIALMI